MRRLKAFLAVAVLASRVVPLGSGAVRAQEAPTEIVVTTNSDASNGDVSTVAGLMASPGDDGISLREVITATNNDPGNYAVRFDATLVGADIMIGSDAQLDLPPLVGGGVTIDGDIDADGVPEITLRRGFEGPSPCRRCAFRIASSNNALRHLAIHGFAYGVRFTPSRTDNPDDSLDTFQTYSNNSLEGLIMTGISQAGVGLVWYRPECDVPGGNAENGCETHNSWTDTRIVGNTIRTRRYGVLWPLGQHSIGDRIERWEVSDNTISIRRSDAKERIGIRFEAGLGVGSTEATISELVIARNEIGGYPDRGIYLASGVGASDDNVVKRVRMVGNHITNEGCLDICAGVSLFLGENSEGIGWDLDPVQYSDRNLLSDVEIKGNVIRGVMHTGIAATPACCGSSNNRIEDLIIVGNTIRVTGLVQGIGIVAASGRTPHSRHSSGNRIVGVTIKSNTITIRVDGDKPSNSSRWLQGASVTLQVGGILFVGGSGPNRDGRIRDVSVAENYIDTRLIAIALIGGTYGTRKGVPEDDVVFDVLLRGNRIPRSPRIPHYVLPHAKGISLIGGFNGARHNRVACVVLRRNRVAGVRNDVLVVSNARSRD
ncbi:MAG: hypothetical protein ACRD1T_05950, partial [Acidimicrobiia bacterium]